MFHFLPPDYKKRVKREYCVRLLAVIFGLLSVVVLSSIFLIAPSYISVRNSYGTALSEATAADNNVLVEQKNNTTTIANKVNAYISAADSLTHLSPQHIVEPIALAKPSNVTISSISIGTAGNVVSVSISGIAGTRDELLAFVKALQGVADFENVNLPVSYLALDKNINYSITLSLAASSSNT